MKVVENTPYQALARCFAGEGSASDEAKVLAWRNASADAASEYEALAEVWEQPFFAHHDKAVINQDEVREEIWQKAFEGKKVKVAKWLRKSKSLFIRVAAVFFVVFLAGLIAYMQEEHTLPENRIHARSAQPGEKVQTTLPDGTKVWLNAGSAITYSVDDHTQDRTVELKGQAFFEVFHHPDARFLVECKGLQMEALGTSFDVNAYPHADKIQVSLLTGKVLLKNERNDEQVELLPGYSSSLDQRTLRLSPPQPFNPEEVLGWKSEKITFKDHVLEEIIPMLELWYGVTIIDQSGVDKHFNGTFQRESLPHVLENISRAMGFRYERQQDTITFKPKK